MNEADRRRILDLLAQGKITVDEAEQLLTAMAGASPAAIEGASNASNDPNSARFVRVNVHKAANQWRPEKQVSIRIPVALARSGMKLGAIIQGFGPEGLAEKLRERGIDLSKLDQAPFEQVLQDMGELSIDVDQGKTQVRISCEYIIGR